MSKEELQGVLEQVRAGDREAVERAIRGLEQTVYSFGMRVCGHREDAEDTMQETLTKAYQQLDRFEDARALVVWLYKVAKNFCLMSRRQSKFAPKETLSLETLMPERGREAKATDRVADSGEQPEQMAMRAEFRRELEEALLRLPANYRLVLVLRDLEGLTNEEVAEVISLPLATVKMRLHRARLFLRQELERRLSTEQSHGKISKAKHPRVEARARRMQGNLRATV